MNGDKELLNYLNKNIDMGIKALNVLQKNLNSTDNKIKSHVSKSLELYKIFYKKCAKLQKKYKSDKPKTDIIATIMTTVGTNSEFKRDNSDSKIADTLIQGYHIGIIDITKKLNMIKGDASKEIIKLCEEYKKMMETGIKDVKGFL